MVFFQGKKVFITGGSSGIGRAAATMLAGMGAHVWIGARRQDLLDEALEQIRAAANSQEQRFGSVLLDVADREQVSRAARQVLDGMGGLDILVNSAGIARPGYLHELSDETFDSMMNVNFMGTANVVRAFTRHFMQQCSGSIVNVSSTLGFMGIFGYSAYAASKFAVTGFSDCLRQDLLPYGVRVSVLFPADTDTPQLHFEEQFKPPETKAISGTIKAVSADSVAMALLRGLAAGRYHIVPGFMNSLTYYAMRLVPWLVRMVIDADLRKARRQLEADT